MRSALLNVSFMSAMFVAAGVANPTFAQAPSDLKARCDQLTSYYDRYGVSRSENSDGARNHTRISAGFDCANGNYEAGIASMEALIRNKHFDVPPANEVYYRVYGEWYLAVHGDMLGVQGGDGMIGAIGPIMRGTKKKIAQRIVNSRQPRGVRLNI